MKKIELKIFAILLVTLLAGTEALLAYNALYTEGEVMQGLYWFLVALNIPILIALFFKPKVSLWAAVGLGVLLLPWQTYENRKWAMIHEEVFSMIHHVDSHKETTGNYPTALNDYEFKKAWVSEHVNYKIDDNKYVISYFMDDPGISYWYESDSGFGYYPD